jgi:hypothetical protein
MGATFHYDYSITIGPLDVDVILVDIVVSVADLSLANLFAPAGFQTIYDAGLGIVSFLPSLGSPSLFAAGTTLSGFGFDSARGPGPSTFQTLDILAGSFVGATIASVGAPIPEPGTAVLLSLGLGVFLAIGTLSKLRRTK